MPTISPFTPQTGTVAGTVSLAVTSTTGNVALPFGGGNQLRIANPGSVVVYLNFGASTVSSSLATSMPLLAGEVEIFTIDTAATAGSVGNQLAYMSGISSVGTATIYVTKGEGY